MDSMVHSDRLDGDLSTYLLEPNPAAGIHQGRAALAGAQLYMG